MVRFFIALCLLFVAALSANASPTEFAKARRSLTQIKIAEKTLAQSIKKMTEAERIKLKRVTRGLDSDGDGLADVLEPSLGANRCDADSDDDGLDDDNDVGEDDSDSDDDGVPDGTEVETKGLVQSFNDPELVVGSTKLQITSTTVFFRGLTSKADLTPGVCVEAEGRRVGTVVLVDKIKRHRGPACGNDGGGDDD
jgi:hypothetical protein